MDRESAISKTGSAIKSQLKTSPFCRDIQYDTNHEGYWTYEDMVVQVEDCIDCLKVVHQDKYQYLFLFDHSNGHDRCAPDALKADSIRISQSGKHPKMQSSTILSSSYLGPYQHSNKLKIGETQQMTFAPTDNSPFYLSPSKREA